MAAAHALCENKIGQAELLLREHLKRHPTDVAAIRMFAEVAGRLRRYQDAENLLARCLELAPSFNAARYNYAMALYRQNRSIAALQQVDLLMASEPRNSGYRNLRAVVLTNIGEFQEALELYADVLAKHPDQSRIWMSYGHALASAGRQPESIAAYRRCIALTPTLGEAYYSLANLKTFRFEDGRALRHARTPAKPRSDGRGSRSFSLRHRQGTGRFEVLPGVVRPLCQRQRAALRSSRLGSSAEHGLGATLQGDVHSGVLCRAPRVRCPGARPDLHRRSAARRLDADRADPGQPLAGGRHHGAARHHGHGAPTLGDKPTGAGHPAIQAYSPG